MITPHIKFAENIKSFFTTTFTFPISARRHFRRLMGLVCILFIAVAAVHVYLFYRIGAHEVFQADSTTLPQAPTVNEGKLTTVLSRYADKAVIRSAALQLQPVVTDPGK